MLPNSKIEIFANKKVELVVLLIFALLVCIGIFHHEPWRDELFTINVCRHANNLQQLWDAKLYTGHPFLYYVLIFGFQKIANSLLSYQLMHGIVAIVSVAIILFRFQLSRLQQFLLIGNYYFLFEFGILARSYTFMILFFVLFIYFFRKIISSNFNEKYFYYSAISLALGTQMHLQFLPFALAAFFYVGCVYFSKIKIGKIVFTFFSFFASIGLAYLSAKVPADGDYFLTSLLPNTKGIALPLITKINIGVFPVSNFSSVHWWNQFIFWYPSLHVILFIAFLFLSIWLINQKGKWFYVLALTGNIYFLALIGGWGFRHFSMVWLSFLGFYWMHNKTAENKIKSALFSALLFVQCIAGLGAWLKDYHGTFSNTASTAKYLNGLHASTPIAGMQDYVLDGLVFYSGKPMYYLGAQQVQQHVVFKNGNFVNPADSSLVCNRIYTYVNLYKQGYLVISNDATVPLIDQYLQNNKMVKSKKVFCSGQNSIVKDEDFVVYYLEQN